MSPTIASLNTLLTRFGVEETLQMLEYSQPFIRQWEQQLREAMLANDWDRVTHCAHKAISSVRLYGSPRLEALLCQIKDSDSSINTPETQNALFTEFANVQQAVSQWISEQP